jgi:hypothetical protein
MKIYDTYRVLFESYTDLITEELLDEVMWMSNKESKLKRGEIPLTSSIVKRMFDEPRAVEAFHITDLKKVFDITNIIGKRNSISAFKYFSDNNIRSARGIQTGGGVVLKIGGVMDIMGSDDIMSTVDMSVNRRWISAEKLSPRLYTDLVNYFAKFTFNQNPSDVKKYMTYMFQLFDKYHDEIQDNLIRMVFTSGFDNGWNELLVKHVRVLSLAWYPEKTMAHYDTDEEREEATNEIIEKLKTLTPNVYTFYDDEDMVKWFQDNGGHIELDDFRRAEFGNYKREDLMKSMGGLIAMVKYDFDYFASNFENVKHLISQNKNSGKYPYREIFNAANKSGHALDMAKIIFMANGKDWNEYENIEKLISQLPSGNNTEFFIWLLEFFGKDINYKIFKPIMTNVNINQRFVDYVFSVFGKKDEIIDFFAHYNPNSVQFMGELSDKMKQHVVFRNPMSLRYIKNPSEELKMFAVNNNGLIIQYIQNPSEAIQLAAVNNNYSAMHFIDNPSEAVQIAAVKNDVRAIQQIKNPSEAVQMLAVEKNPIIIEYIKNPSEAVQMAAIRKNPYAFGYIQDPTDAVKMVALSVDGRYIQYMQNPSEELQIAAVQQNPDAIRYMLNPTDKVKAMVNNLNESRKKIRNILRN